MSIFNYLPDEVCCRIFDHLRAGELKIASLTCRRWCQLIFSDFYIQRFRLKINLCLMDNVWLVRTFNAPVIPPRIASCCIPWPLQQQPRRKSNHELEQISRRHYRNVTMVCRNRSELNENVIDVLLNLLPLSALERVEALTVVLDSNLNASITPDGAAGRIMTRLKSLHLIYYPQREERDKALEVWRDQECWQVYERNTSELHQEYPNRYALEIIELRDAKPVNWCDHVVPWTVVESDTITNFELKAVNLLQMNLPNLKSLDCTLDNRGENEIYAQTFEQLKILKLSNLFWNASRDKRIRFYRHHHKLETLSLQEERTPEQIFQTICDTSRNLVKLNIDHLEIYNCAVLDKLSLLKNLKILSLPRISASCKIFFPSVHLPKLENLHLDVSKDFSRSFSCFGNLKCLTTSLPSGKMPPVFDAIVMNFELLQELRLHLPKERVPPRTFRNLNSLRNLRKLELTGGYLGRNLFDQCPPAAGGASSSLETIALNSCCLQARFFNLRAVALL